MGGWQEQAQDCVPFLCPPSSPVGARRKRWHSNPFPHCWVVGTHPDPSGFLICHLLLSTSVIHHLARVALYTGVGPRAFPLNATPRVTPKPACTQEKGVLLQALLQSPPGKGIKISIALLRNESAFTVLVQPDLEEPPWGCLGFFSLGRV